MSHDSSVPHLGKDNEDVRPLTAILLRWCMARPMTMWPERIQEKLHQWGNTFLTWCWLWMRLKETAGVAITGLVVFGMLGFFTWSAWKALTCD